MADLDLRAGDDDRQATVERLAAHFRAGRLSSEELEERSAAAHAARTHGDLAALEHDLPAAGAPQRPPAAGEEVAERERGRGFREQLVTYVAVIGLLWLIWLLTGHGYPWPIWPMAGWGLGLVLDRYGGRDRRRRERDDRRRLPRDGR